MRIGKVTPFHHTSLQQQSNSYQKKGQKEIASDKAINSESKPSAKEMMASIEKSKQQLKEEQAKIKEQEMQQELKRLQEQLEAGKEQAEGTRKLFEKKLKCLKIAMRILHGDIVPRADQRFLAENEPGLYSMAMSLRTEREDPKKYKRLSEEEKVEEQAGTDNAVDESGESTESGVSGDGSTEEVDPAAGSIDVLV